MHFWILISLALHSLTLTEAFWALAVQPVLTVNLWTMVGLTMCSFLMTQTPPLHDLLKPPLSLTVTFGSQMLTCLLIVTCGPHDLSMVVLLATVTVGPHDLWTTTLGPHDL